MNIAISGASGFIGTYLTSFFQSKGCVVIPLTRELLKDRVKLKQKLFVCEVVINLAGSPINRRWNKKYKQELRDSRILPTQAITDAINQLDIKPHLFISASAVGYYRNEGCYGEHQQTKGNGFLSDLCDEWEKASRTITNELRLVNARFGIVFSKTSGAFPKMISGANLGMTFMPGSGKQYISWIDIEDLARAMEFIIQNKQLEGVVNFTTPSIMTYRDFTKSITHHYHTFVIHIPSLLLRALMGEAVSLILVGQCVRPDKLLNAGFVFRSNTFNEFLISQYF